MNKNLKEIKEKFTYPLRQATLVFLMKDDEILLAMKKRDLELIDGMALVKKKRR
jgi:hypothetical protein